MCGRGPQVKVGAVTARDTWPSLSSVMTHPRTFKRASIAEYKQTTKNPQQQTVFIIENIVHDVTKFVDDHPGGSEVLRELSGKDASEEFYDIGHSSYAKEMMVKYRLGEVIEQDKVEVKQREDSWLVYEESLRTAPKPGFMRTWAMPAMIGLIITIVYTYFNG